MSTPEEMGEFHAKSMKPEEQDHWNCVRCNYMNAGGICTHCGWVHDPAEEFAKKYHDLVEEAHRKAPSQSYIVWTWDEIPEQPKNAQIEAARRMLADGYGK